MPIHSMRETKPPANNPVKPTANNPTKPPANNGFIDGKPICKGRNADPDGDGYGWENNQSCVVVNNGSGNNPVKPTTPPPTKPTANNGETRVYENMSCSKVRRGSRINFNGHRTTVNNDPNWWIQFKRPNSKGAWGIKCRMR